MTVLLWLAACGDTTAGDTVDSQSSPPLVDSGDTGDVETTDTADTQKTDSQADTGDTHSTTNDTDTGGDSADPCEAYAAQPLPSGTVKLDELEPRVQTAVSVFHGREGDLDGDGHLDMIWAGGSFILGNAGPSCGGYDSWEDPTLFIVHDPVIIGFAHYDLEAADIDGDGLMDLVAGTASKERDEGREGEVYVLMAPHPAEQSTPEDSAQATFESSLGDVGNYVALLDANSDGQTDFVVETPAWEDGVWADIARVVYGPVSGLVDAGTSEGPGIYSDEVVGFSNLRSWGDTDGDGLDDLFVGYADAVSDAGAISLFLGPLAGDQHWTDADTLVYGHTAYQGVGDAISFGRDVNGDGYNDLLTGGHHGGTPGSAFLVLGPLTDSGRLDQVASLEVDPDVNESELGAALSLEQDLDNDGLADLVIGAPRSYMDWPGSLRRGGAMVWFGNPPTGTVTFHDADILLLGEEDPNEGAGEGIFSPGDINEDGYEDVLIGSGYGEYSNLLLGGPR